MTYLKKRKENKRKERERERERQREKIEYAWQPCMQVLTLIQA